MEIHKLYTKAIAVVYVCVHVSEVLSLCHFYFLSGIVFVAVKCFVQCFNSVWF